MKEFGQSLLNLWKQLGLNQRVSLIVASLAVVAGLVALVIWSRQPDYQLLYGRLSDKDSAAIISELETENIPHKIANGGSTVYVPSDQVYKLRMSLASKGLPAGDGVGFEIFDKGQFGLSDFVQRTNYMRALQGELARTIDQLDGVASSRVMIVQPENRLLVTGQGVKPTASVFVELSRDNLKPEAVNAIRHLVANAVQGLVPDDVAVVDNRGRVLSEALKEDPLLGSAASQMRYKEQVEQYLSQKVQSMLEPVIGAGQVVVRVSAQIDTESSTQTQESYNPDSQVVRQQSITDDTSNSSESHSGGATGVSSNTPGGAGAQDAAGRPVTTNQTSRKTQTTSYEINRTVTNITHNPGALKAVTASVFIAERMAAPPPGAPAGSKPVPQPRSPQELNALRQIVMNALGLQLAPGQNPDSLVTLEEVPFTTTNVSKEIATIQKETAIQSWMSVGSRYVSFFVAAGLFYLFLRMLKKQRPQPVPVELLAEMPAVSQRGALQIGSGGVTPEVLNELIRQKPMNVGAALRDWASIKKVG
ncbi:flagellar M-ring protein [mine drainage metagenome]|uniref:Flagellar M-ring protein n=1 Tax=mine drainage metagenome TaxID=410659 RepID=A0A1J5TF95_9ZZZZ